MPTEAVLTLNEAADYLGMTAAELKEMTDNGYGPRVINPSFTRADLDAWNEEMLGVEDEMGVSTLS